MRILSLDSTTRDGSAAIVEDDRVIDVRRGDAARSHAERLPGELIGLLDARGLSFADVDVFAVACGPGSFTGLRIGIATIQGLALTIGRRVVAVSALDALAHAAAPDLVSDRSVISWMDAHRREVFSGVYRIGDGAPFEPGRLVITDAARVGPPATLLDGLRATPAATSILFTGDGAVMYADDIRRAFPAAEIVAPEPIAGVIGLLASALARRGETIEPAAIQPLYVRRPDAVVAREARESAS